MYFELSCIKIHKQVRPVGKSEEKLQINKLQKCYISLICPEAQWMDLYQIVDTISSAKLCCNQF